MDGTCYLNACTHKQTHILYVHVHIAIKKASFKCWLCMVLFLKGKSTNFTHEVQVIRHEEYYTARENS